MAVCLASLLKLPLPAGKWAVSNDELVHFIKFCTQKCCGIMWI